MVARRRVCLLPHTARDSASLAFCWPEEQIRLKQERVAAEKRKAQALEAKVGMHAGAPFVAHSC